MPAIVQKPEQFYSANASAYARYISWFLYPQGFQAFFASREWLTDGMRVMDAGCGTGVVSFGLLKALHQRGYDVESVNAFDLTQAMLDLFRIDITQPDTRKIALCQANVLELEKLPAGWNSYDLIISSGMLEYISRDIFSTTLANLRARLKPNGRFVLFMTKQSWITELLIERPWGGNRYTQQQLSQAFHQAGFNEIKFSKYPLTYGWLNLWAHIVEAKVV